MSYAGLLLAAYLLGGVPFSWIAVKVFLGRDVRKHGSGNPGATNASRMWPKGRQLPPFVAIFLLDAGKGYLAAGYLPGLFGEPGGAVWAAAAAVAGHSFTPFLGFRGGKGVATTVGALCAIEPLATGIAVAAFFVVFGFTRIVAAGSLAVAVTLPVAVYLADRARDANFYLAVILCLLIIVRHRSNIGNMIRGTED